VKSNNRALLIVFEVLLALALIGPMIGGTLFGPGGMWEDIDRAAGWALPKGMAGFAGLSLLAIPAAPIVGIVVLVRWLGGGTSAGPGRRAIQEEKGKEERDPALGTLRRRYAVYEISQEEYETMRKTPER
jgi:uncharacterized membrane protein